jgi:hypothetical protein
MDKKNVFFLSALGALGAMAGFLGAKPATVTMAEASCWDDFGICSCGICCGGGGGCDTCYNRLDPTYCAGYGGPCMIPYVCGGPSGSSDSSSSSSSSSSGS